MLITAAFYLFATVLLLSSTMVVLARNPVHSVLFLILAFFNAAGLFVLLGAEFVAMILVIVYVGAVAVLFLFVVMMLDIDLRTLRTGLVRHAALGLAIGIALLAQLYMVFIAWDISPGALALAQHKLPPAMDNTKALGQVLYTDFAYPFQVSGLILLVAMIGAITLTLRERGGVKKQNIHAQIERDASSVLAIARPEKGQGVVP